MPSVQLKKGEFFERARARFYDPTFATVAPEIEKIIEVAWKNYTEYHKSPRTRRAGRGFSDPEFALPIEWLETRSAIGQAEKRQKNSRANSRILLINGSTRSDQTCPGEMSKTFRLAKMAEEIFARAKGVEVDLLDLSRLASEYGRIIYPCKACVSTAMPLCHWPCSCYPNHAMGQVNDWMAEIYPRWVAAHGIMILCPVNWYQAPSSLKLMIDRLVCADGGNPDPTLDRRQKSRARQRSRAQRMALPAPSRRPALFHRRARRRRRRGNPQANSHGLVDGHGPYCAGNAALVDGYVGYYRPMRPATTIWIKTKIFTKKCEMPRAVWSMLSSSSPG